MAMNSSTIRFISFTTLLAFLLTLSSCKLIHKILDLAPPTPQNLEAKYINQSGLAEISWDKVAIADEYRITLLEEGTNNVVLDTIVLHNPGPSRDTLTILVSPATYDVECRSRIIDSNGILENGPAETILEWDGIIEDVVVMKEIDSGEKENDACPCSLFEDPEREIMSVTPDVWIDVPIDLAINQREIFLVKLKDGADSICIKLGVRNPNCTLWDIEKVGGNGLLEFCDENENTVSSEAFKRLKIQLNSSVEPYYLKSGIDPDTEVLKFRFYPEQGNYTPELIELTSCLIENENECPQQYLNNSSD